MVPKNQIAAVPPNLVAIQDKDVLKTGSFRTETIELYSQCGARFSIGYLGATTENSREKDEVEKSPGRLIEILTKDHRQERQHKGFIDLDL
jgi:hypothetical protein